ncbi:OmpA family protein [Salinisphaera sp. USBA-960]|uniref:OmpA family protein n=1 Tax=Salinisphaera orenii TaxID=856731 RepID=UPI0013A60729|nr:OmpA family protein [Salifodinibacter halophilus]NNC26063.1 OmpA family protein [Salifodinibacter halophilus]
MNTKRVMAASVAGTISLALSGGAFAANADKPMDKRVYIAPMVSYGFFDDDTITHNPDGKLERDNVPGGTLALGKPINKWLNLELYGFYFNPSQTAKVRNSGTALDGNHKTGKGSIWGVGVDAMLFPARNTFPIYGLLGASFGQHGVNTPEGSSNGNLETQSSNREFTRYLDAGIGYVYPITDYGIKVRAEWRYRYTDVNSSSNTMGQHLSDAKFGDNILSLGLQIPLGAAPQATSTEPAPEPQPKDSDNDGVLNKNDQCPDTAPGAEVNAKGCQIKQTKPEPVELKGVTFRFDNSSLTDQANRRLQNVVSALQQSPEVDFRLDGYTDSVGPQSYNLGLSQRRTDSVKSYLLNHQISGSRITGAKGHGEKNPVTTNKTKAGRAKNRRVEITVTDGPNQ